MHPRTSLSPKHGKMPIRVTNTNYSRRDFFVLYYHSPSGKYPIVPSPVKNREKGGDSKSNGITSQWALMFPLIYTGCEGYCRPFFKMFSCINRSSDHDKIFTVYPPLHLLLSTGVHLPARLKGPRQENQRAVIVKIIRAIYMREDGKWQI